MPVFTGMMSFCSPRMSRVAQSGPTIEEISEERLEAFKLKVQKQERLERLWTTHGTAARSKCSVWAPIVTQGNFVQRNKVKSSGFVADSTCLLRGKVHACLGVAVRCLSLPGSRHLCEVGG